MKLLLIEDQAEIREPLVNYLKGQHYSVDAAADGLEGHYLGMEYQYDIAIVDLGLPKMDGIDILSQWRKAGRNFPVLLLTARGSWQDKVQGLSAGGDDYLVKPFHNEELNARLQALARRACGHATSEITTGPYTLNTLQKKLSLNGSACELTQFEYNLVEYLILHTNEVISKSVLTETLYEQDFDKESNVIEVLIGRIRKKIDPSNHHKPITTLRGQGYLWRSHCD